MKTQEIGLIIGSIDYKETSKIVYLITSLGKKSVLVPGGNKYEKGFLSFKEPLNLVSYEVTDGSLPKLISFSLVDNYLEIKKDLASLSYAYLILELVSKLIIDKYYDRFYAFLLEILNKLKKGDSLIWTTIFLTKMLYFAGILPLFKEDKGNFTNIADLDILYHLKNLEDYPIKSVDYKQLLKELSEYYEKYGGINLKSIKLIKTD